MADETWTRDQMLSAPRKARTRGVGQWVAVLVILVLAAMLINALVTQPNFAWPVVGQYFFSRPILAGVGMTIALTMVIMCLGVIIGTCLAVMDSSKNKIVRSAAVLYVWLFRGTPVLVQIVFWYNIAALLPTIGLGIPFGPMFVEFPTNGLVTPLVAATLGLALPQAAYTAEIVRGGMLGVDSGQLEAGSALGFRRMHILRHIVGPQALPIIIPAIGNEVIGMLKYTSLVSTIAVGELLHSATVIYSRTFQTIPLLIVAALWYLILTSVFTFFQGRIERSMKRGRAVRTHKPLPKSGRFGPGSRRRLSTIGGEL